MTWFRRKTDFPSIERIQALEVHPTDVVVVTLPRGLEPSMLERARDVFIEALKGKGATVLVAEKGAEISLVRSSYAKTSSYAKATEDGSEEADMPLHLDATGHPFDLAKREAERGTL